MSFPENSIGELLTKLNIPFAFDADFPRDISGIVYVEDGGVKIAVNKSDSRQRRVFSLAHELGHYKLGHIEQGAKYRISTYRYDDSNETIEETEANYFAATLLVPRRRLVWALEQSRSIKTIADYFGVSVPVINNRINWLGV